MTQRYCSIHHAGMRHEPSSAVLGRRPGGYASHHCKVHTCAIIFGIRPLLPLRTNKSLILLIADSVIIRLCLIMTSRSSSSEPMPQLFISRFKIHIQPHHLSCHLSNLLPRFLDIRPSDLLQNTLIVFICFTIIVFTISIKHPTFIFYSTCY